MDEPNCLQAIDRKVRNVAHELKYSLRREGNNRTSDDPGFLILY